MRPAEPVPPRVSRLQVPSSGTAALSINGVDRDLAITPDGSRVVYVGNRGTQLFVRALDALEPVAVFTGVPRSRRTDAIAIDAEAPRREREITVERTVMGAGEPVGLDDHDLAVRPRHRVDRVRAVGQVRKIARARRPHRGPRRP